MKINIIVYGIRNAPPPCLKQRYGNRQTLPKPEKIKVIEIRYGLQGHFTLSSHVYFINLSKFIYMPSVILDRSHDLNYKMPVLEQ